MMKRYQRHLLLALALVVFPLMPGTAGLLGSAAQIAVYTVVAASLVLLTGWVGQISLAHATFVGVGAYATGWASGSLGLTFPLSLPVAMVAAGALAALLGVVALRVRGLYLAVATLIFAWASSEYLFRQSWILAYDSIPKQAIGLEGSLLYLDFGSRMVHYYVAWAVAIAVVFGLTNLRDSKTGRAFYAVRGSEMAAASLGMDVLRYKTLAFALSGAIAGLAGNLTMTHARVVSADAFDVNGSLFFLAIAVVGGLTSLAGAIAASAVFAVMSEVFFRVSFLNQFLQLFSALLLALVFRLYPGGLAAMGEQALGRIKATGTAIRRLPRRVEEALVRREAAAAALTLDPQLEPEEEDRIGRVGVAVRAVRARLTSVIGSMSSRVLDRMRARREKRTVTAHAVAPLEFAEPGAARAGVAPPRAASAVAGVGTAARVSTNGHGPTSDRPDGSAADEAAVPELHVVERLDAPSLPPRDQRKVLLEAKGITVRFGGLTAVDDANLTVREGEITGLIGPNGAGKTTLFNSIAGYNQPTEGRVLIHGQDVTNLPVHRRAQLGVARTFQLIQLFPQITVFENLLAATHLQNPTGWMQHVSVSAPAMAAEAKARDRVRRVIDLLELHEFADRKVAGLPFGVLRMIEVARSLVSGARIIMLDEPASGLDERETDNLMEVLRFVRSLGATLLLIEHDIRMVTSVTDYLYVLNRGQIIADGTPKAIQEDPEVISAYLGATTEPEPVEVS